MDLINKRFGKLVVESFSHKDPKYRYLYWNCKCDCGSYTKLPTASLNRKKNPTQSCGCLRKERLSLKGAHNKQDKGLANLNSLFSSYIKTAKKRDIEFDLTLSDFKVLTKGNCYYCGIEPNQIHKRNETNGSYLYNGIDRVDSNYGYKITNVVSCCKTCNYAKRLMTTSEFINWIKRVFNNTFEWKCT